jgi:hypothetical protein
VTTQPIPEAREAHLLRQIATLGCPTEARWFADALEEQGELTGLLRLRIAERMDQFEKRK